jgi:toxin CcdB
MARFDVVRVAGGALALDCQSDLLDHLSSRFTAPLVPAASFPRPIAGLHPCFDINGEPFVMLTHLAGAIPLQGVQEKVTTLAEHEYVIQRALDTLAGFY